MRIAVAPDKFKGSLSAMEVATAICEGIREVIPRAEIEVIPIADGGEGTAEVIFAAVGGCWVTCRVHDPLGRQIDARYLLIDSGSIAVIEMCEAAGLHHLTETELDPLRATTFGVGELIVDAARRQVAHIVVGLGGSATNDGGFGMARALAYRFFDNDGSQLRTAIRKLRTLKRIERPRNLVLPPIIGAFDVHTPLLGRRGTSRVFSPQKGATPVDVAVLEKSLKRLARVAARQVRSFHPQTRGAGAAGGLGFGLAVFAGASLQPGFELVAKIIRAQTRIRQADLVITGEGSLDAQSLAGKAPAAMAALARSCGKPVFAIAGRIENNRKIAALFDTVYALECLEPDVDRRMTGARELVRKAAGELARRW
jgi:glycerate kinase